MSIQISQNEKSEIPYRWQHLVSLQSVFATLQEDYGNWANEDGFIDEH